MSQSNTASNASFNLLRDSSSQLFILTMPGNAWAQLPEESAKDFYLRLQTEFNGSAGFTDAAVMLENLREQLLTDDYVDPILYEAGFFQNKAHHDEVMQRVLVNFEASQRKQG